MLGNGEFLRREGEYRALAAKRRATATAERAKVAAMTPAQKATYEAKKAALAKAIKEAGYWRQEWARGVEAGRNLGAQSLSAKGKILRNIIVRRDWDALFKLFPLYHPDGKDKPAAGKGVWNPIWAISKYSFTGDGANKRYVPWTEADIRSWVFSPYYTIQPGHTCSDAQRNTGVAAYMKAQNRHKQKFGPTTYHYVWPIYPGRGYGDQSYGCQRDKDSWWVKNRKKVVAVVAVVAAVYLGPIVMSKIGAGAAKGGAAAAGTGTGAGATAAQAGIVGAGTKAGMVTAVTTKAGTGLAITAKSVSAATAISGATQATNWVAKTKQAVDVYNKANAVKHIINGELPPPPISLTGESFTDIAMNLAKKEISSEITERAGEYISKKAREKIEREEEARLRAEIEAMQRELAKFAPPGTPVAVSTEFTPDIRDKLLQMQAIEMKRQKDMFTLFAVGAGGALLLLG